MLGENVVLRSLPGRGVWATFLLEGAAGPRAVLKVVSPRRARLVAQVNDPNPFYANETPSQRLVREGKTHEALAPYGLAPSLLDSGEDYLLMAYVSGPSLAERKGDSKEELMEVVTSVVEAFGRMHRLGYTHGDARPDNVVLAEKGPVFVDFEHLIDPRRPVGEQRALDWLRFFHLLYHFRPDVIEGHQATLSHQMHQLLEPGTLEHLLEMVDVVDYDVPPALLKSLKDLEA